MYTKYYGLTKKPFENTPDPDFLFLLKNHREVLASLAYAINAAKGFVLVVGDIGIGKATLTKVSQFLKYFRFDRPISRDIFS